MLYRFRKAWTGDELGTNFDYTAEGRSLDGLYGPWQVTIEKEIKYPASVYVETVVIRITGTLLFDTIEASDSVIIGGQWSAVIIPAVVVDNPVWTWFTDFTKESWSHYEFHGTVCISETGEKPVLTISQPTGTEWTFELDFLKMTQLDLHDIDGTSLQYISAAEHPYFGGNTRIAGTITVEGAEDDKLQFVELEVIQGGAVVANAHLSTLAQEQLLNHPFGAAKKVEISQSQLLFELPSAQAANIDGSANGTVILRALARSSDGDEVSMDFPSVSILVRYSGNNRYGTRDEDVGGDDWTLPSVRDFLEQFPNIRIGDISNMNGGSFSPHQGHRDGRELDGWFEGYNARDAAAANYMIDLLNTNPHGSRIERVYVTFQLTATDSFWQTIKNVVLYDGRLARDVISPANNHDTHFHWTVRP